MKKIILSIVVLTFVFSANAQASPSDEAQALFAQGKYLEGRNILTNVLNDPDPTQRASAMLVYGRFYDNIVGNTDYALNFYNDIMRINLPENSPVKSDALKEEGKINELKIKYKAEDAFLKKLRPAESAGRRERQEQIAQLLSITQQKPDYYRLSEVHYQLGRNYLAAEEYHNAYLSLKKSLALKPGVNFYLPVNVWMDTAYGKWVRANIHTASWGILGGLLVLTIIVFYASCPWRWLRFRHLIIGFSIALLWLIVFGVLYKWFAGRPKVSDATMIVAGVIPPYFFSFGLDGPFWKITQNLFVYGLVGVLGVLVFSIGTNRLKSRWMAALINLVFAVLLFTSLTAVFYMRNCDQKSLFGSEWAGAFYYLSGNNYFVTVGIEPYVLTNPKAYPDLTINNVADPYMRAWLIKYCVTPENKPSH